MTIHDETLIASLKEEAKDKESKGKKKLPRSLVSILGIAPSEQDDGKVENLDGVFGKIFGEKIDSTEKNNTGSVVKTFTIEDEPLGFKEGVIFGTPKTHQTYMIRAVFAQSDLKDAYNAAKKLFGDVIGMEFTKGAGRTHVCHPKNSRGTCMIEVIEEDDRVFIDITDLTLYKLVEEEKNGDTFGFIPRIRKGVDPKEIKGVFGRELGCSVSYMETELNDNGALVATINPDENDFGFDAFLLFATPKTKKTFMIRAAYTGSDIDDKRIELVMTLKKMLGKSPSLDKSGDWYFINWVADKITRQQNVVGFICLKSKTIPVYCIKII